MKKGSSAMRDNAMEERLESVFRAFLASLARGGNQAVSSPRFRNSRFLGFLLGKIELKCRHDPAKAFAWAKAAVRLASGLGNASFSAALDALSAVHLAMNQEEDAERVHRLALFVDPVHADRQHLLRLARAGHRDQARRAALHGLLIAQGLGEQARGRALVNLGVVHEMAGDLYEASCRFMEALQALTFREDEAIYSRAAQGLTNGLAHHLHLRRLAKRAVDLRLQTCARSGRPWFLLRWVEGMVYKMRAPKKKMLYTIRAVRVGLHEKGTLPEAFFSSLDYADALIGYGQVSEASQELREAAAAVKGSALERECLTELRWLKAIEIGSLTHDNLLKARAALYRRLFLEGSLA